MALLKDSSVLWCRYGKFLKPLARMVALSKTLWQHLQRLWFAMSMVHQVHDTEKCEGREADVVYRGRPL
jgi:hypothetical protein